MRKPNTLAYVGVLLVGAALVWALFVVLPGLYPEDRPVESPVSAAPETATRKITAHLFFVAEDGLTLESVEQDVVYGEGTIEQAEHLVEAQLSPAPPPLTSAIPPGTRLHRVFVSERGEAFVDLSTEVRSAHPGGSLNELFTVYSIVNALTVNLPAITAVQILIDGVEVDSLSGHVDLRRPLQQNDRLVNQAVDDRP